MVKARLEANDVAVWYQQTDVLAPAELDAMTAVLSDDERARADRFVFARDRRDFTAAHALVRRVLSRYGTTAPEKWRFDTHRHGKPSIVAAQAGTPPLAFNLSHTHGLVACAVARGTTVGIDVERIGRVVTGPEIALRYFAPSEIAMLEACDAPLSQIRFIELWTLKESYIKAVGTGLLHGLDSFAFAFEGARQLRFLPAPGTAAADWQFLLAAPTTDSRIALAVGGGTLGRQWRLAMYNASQQPSAPATRVRWSVALRG